MGVSWTILTPAGPGAVGGLLLVASDADELSQLLRVRLGGDVQVGAVVRRRLLEVDDGLVARWSERSVELMPHGGTAVMRGLVAAVNGIGAAAAARLDDAEMYPEAADVIEARLLATLARARSPRAIDVLMAQRERWGRGEVEIEAGLQRELRRLIDPPLVVAMGPANIGKSTLVNALAGRRVSIVADEPGTTRDHVGAMLELGGVVVRYVDTPGVREGGGAAERDALSLALALAAEADLLLLCGDPTNPPVDLPGLRDRPALRVCLRGDLIERGGGPAWGPDVVTAAARGEGIGELARAVADRLVSPEALSGGGAWRFWE
jgi:tRNA modification GTPase